MAFGLSAGAVAAIGAVAGAGIAANATSKAAKTQAGAANAATAVQQQQYEQTREDQAPYRQAGYTALHRLQTLLGLDPTTLPANQQAKDTSWQTSANFDAARYLRENPDVAQSGKDALVHWIQAGQFEGRQFPGDAPASGTPGAAPGSQSAVDPTTDPMYGYLTRQFTGKDLANEPGYQFGLQQGTQAVERSASARGGLFSGATLKALQRYGTDYGSTKFNEAFNRDQVSKDSLFNMLSGISGTGQKSSALVADAGANYANNAAGNIWGAANTSAANSLAQGNILQSGVNQGLSLWMQGRKGTGATYPLGSSAFDVYTGVGSTRGSGD